MPKACHAASMAACQPRMDSSDPSFLGTPTSLGSGAGTPACWGLCFKRRNREGFLMFFLGALLLPRPNQGKLLLSEISDISTQIKVRLNVSTAEIPPGSRWRRGTPSQLSTFPPSPRVEQKHQFTVCYQTIQSNPLRLQMGKLRPRVRNGVAQVHSTS